MKAYLDHLTILFFTLLLIGCSHKSQNAQAKFPDYLPEQLIIDNFNDADFVVAMEVDTVILSAEESIRDDSGKIGYAMLIYEGDVFHSYKGNLKKGRISFRNVQEYDDELLERLNEKKMSKIVFLRKGKKAGEYIAPEFAVFNYSKELHSALIDFVSEHEPQK